MIDQDGWQKFLKLCYKAKSIESLNEIFDFLLSMDEKHQLADRIRLIAALLEGEQTQREISKSLHVSIAKITRGSNQLKMVDEGFKKRLKKILID